MTFDAVQGAGLQQNIATHNAASYVITFDISAALNTYGSIPLQVFWNNTLLDTITPTGQAWVEHSYTVQGGAGDTSNLAFKNAPGNYQDASGTYTANSTVLDNISVVGTGGTGGDKPLTTHPVVSVPLNSAQNVFVFTGAHFGDDVITNFVSGADHINLSKLPITANMIAGHSSVNGNGNLQLTFDQGTITVMGHTSLDASDFIFAS